ncbi:MAG: porin [Sphingobacteriales bacterium]|nr:porin [Sphingobacteriales bacterium]
MIKFIAAAVAFLWIPQFAFAQTDTLKNITWSAYTEMYYCYNFDKPYNHEQDAFIYNHKRHNEVNINLAYIKASLSKAHIRSNLAMMVGNYAQYNLSAEPTWAQFVYEANVGIQLSKQNNWWLDAGIMPSHIGFESAVAADCATLTRSLVAENSPYFETGVKLSYTSDNQQLYAALLLLNGWQQVQKYDDVQKPAWGMQITYSPKPNITLNYSNFIGESNYGVSQRFYHNLYAHLQMSADLRLTLGFDMGQDFYKNPKQTVTWSTPVVIGSYQIKEKHKIAARAEYFNDSDGVIISSTENGAQILGASINYDYQIFENVLFRTELKHYHSEQRVFFQNQTSPYNNFRITAALSVKI